MAQSLAVAAAPLFSFTDRQAADLWATSILCTSDDENDLRCLANFLYAIEQDVESVVKVIGRDLLRFSDKLHRSVILFIAFLDASTHLYNRVCPSVRPSVRPSVDTS